MNNTMDIPYIARMIFINDVILDNGRQKFTLPQDSGYYNSELDSSCDYCLNTSAWD